VLKSIGVPFTPITGKAEALLGNLHEKCIDLLDVGGDQDGVVILTMEEYFFRLGEFRDSGKVNAPAQLPLPTVALPTMQTATGTT